MGGKGSRRSRVLRKPVEFAEGSDDSHCKEQARPPAGVVRDTNAWYSSVCTLWPWVSWYGPLTFLFWIIISAYGLDASHHAQITTWAFRMAGGLGFRIVDEFLALTSWIGEAWPRTILLTLFLTSTLFGTERVLRVPLVIAVLMSEAM